MKKYIQSSTVVEIGVLYQAIMAGSVGGVNNGEGYGEDATNAGIFDNDENQFVSSNKKLWED